jgi:hypothetical protein
MDGYLKPKATPPAFPGIHASSYYTGSYLPYNGPAYHLRQLASKGEKDQSMTPMLYDAPKENHKKDWTNSNDPKKGA